ncbi:MAG TPA: ABC transporter permease [Thermoanaerobaculia bacterium]|jgi:putative ABC transport system permease protein|nr:ABC transporter permease [Thermoanaerobaculia bacterium]
MDRLLQDLRLAVRSIGQNRGITAVICLSIALAIAGNATVFSLIEAALLRPFPYRDAEHLLVVLETRGQAPDDPSLVAAANLLDWRERSRSFSALEALCPGTLALTGGDHPEELEAMIATPGLLSLLGVTPERGRSFEPADGQPGHSAVALLTYDLWRKRFGGDPKILGSTIRLDDVPHTVVGILPEGFELFSRNVQVWVPLVLDRAKAERDRHDLMVMARLSPEATLAGARHELEAIAQRLEAEHPAENRGFAVQVNTLREQFPNPSDRKLYVLLQTAMLLILLIACANVANVLLARGQDRRAEIAVRAALGGGRGRIVRQLLTESLLLAGIGALLGLVFARASIELFSRLLSDKLPRHFTPTLDARVIFFGLAASLAAGLIFGLAPAFATSRPDLSAALGQRSRTATEGRRRRWVSHGLVVVELALALIMMSGTGLLLKAMIDLRALSPGFDPDRLLTARLSLPAVHYDEPHRAAAFEQQVVERLSLLPGVVRATASSNLPRSRGIRQLSVAGTEEVDAPAEDRSKDSPLPPATIVSVPAGYFDALGVGRLAGRDFSSLDVPESEPVALIGRTAARRFFPSSSLGDVVGRKVALAGRQVRIVGVVGDVLQGQALFAGAVPPTFYRPYAQTPEANLYFLVRTKGEPLAVGDAVRTAIEGIDPKVAVAEVRTFRDHVNREFRGERAIIAVMGTFGGVALLLAAVGVYGMISYSVLRRTRELGIRIALGADRRDLVLLVAKRGLGLTALGLLLGAPGVGLAYWAIAGQLAGLVPISPATIPAVVLALVAVAGFASVEPVNRAASVDPTIVLRG